MSKEIRIDPGRGKASRCESATLPRLFGRSSRHAGEARPSGACGLIVAIAMPKCNWDVGESIGAGLRNPRIPHN